MSPLVLQTREHHLYFSIVLHTKGGSRINTDISFKEEKNDKIYINTMVILCILNYNSMAKETINNTNKRKKVSIM